MKNNLAIFALVGGLALLLAGSALAYNHFSTGSAQLQPLSGGDESQTAAEEEDLGEEGREDGPYPAPDFLVYDGLGNEVRLSDFLGQPVVVNFWASWCPPCKAEMPEFDRVWAELGGEVAFLMVDMVDGSRETREAGAAYVAEQGFSFPVYYDSDQIAAYQYRVTSIPSTYFVDAQGNLAAAAQGQIDENTLRVGIEMAKEGA